MSRAFTEFVVNAAWQLPVLAAGAWVLVRVAKPSAAAQYRIWVGVLALAVVLPLIGVMTDAGARVEVDATTTVAARGAGSTSETALRAGLVNASPIEMASEGTDAANGMTGTVSSAESPADHATPAPTPLVPSLMAAKVERMWRTMRLTRRFEVSARAAEWTTGVYLLVMLLGLMRIARAWSAARRLARMSDRDALTSEERALVADCARRMRLREPEVRVVDDADGLQGPVVVGARRPVLLCPEGFVRGLMAAGREDEAIAALCHEMAHIRRRDYAANLLCEAMAAGLRWHPVTCGVERRIRGTREMACDAMAARVMESDAEYARCLVGLAERMTMGGMVEQAGAMGLFNGNALEERVMRLMETEKAMSVRAKMVRGVVGVAAMAAAVAMAGMVHVVPARAQTETTPVVVQSTGTKAAPIAEESAPVNPVVAVARPRFQVRTPVHVVVRTAVAPAARVEVRVVSAPVRIAEVVKPVIAVDPVIETDAPQVLVKPEAKPVPAPKAAPEPKPAPALKRGRRHHHEAIVSRDGKLYVWENGKERALTPAERARMEKKLEAAQRQLAAETARINSPEFEAQIAKAQRDAMEAERRIESGEMQRQIVEAQKQVAVAMAKLQSPEFKKQMEAAQREAMADMQKQMNSAAIEKQMAEAKRQMAAAMAKIDSPEFKRQMEEAQRDAMEAQKKMMSGEIQKQMEEVQKQIQRQLDELKAQGGK